MLERIQQHQSAIAAVLMEGWNTQVVKNGVNYYG